MSSEKTDFTLSRHLRMTELCEALALRAGRSDFFDSLKNTAGLRRILFGIKRDKMFPKLLTWPPAGFRLAWQLINELNMYEKTRPLPTPREAAGMDAFDLSEKMRRNKTGTQFSQHLQHCFADGVVSQSHGQTERLPFVPHISVAHSFPLPVIMPKIEHYFNSQNIPLRSKRNITAQNPLDFTFKKSYIVFVSNTNTF